MNEEFIITFGQKDATRRNGWVRLTHCSGEPAARAYAWDHFGHDWSMIYTPEEFEGRQHHFPTGEIKVIEVHK